MAKTDFSSQNRMSPSPSAGPASADAVRMAISGSAQSATMSGRNVDGTPPTPSGLNTKTGPWPAR